MKRFYFIASLCIFVLGCERAPENKATQQPVTVASTPGPKDPVSELKEILAKYAQADVVTITQQEGDAAVRYLKKSSADDIWSNKRFRFSVISYDVKKTDSMISPYIAYVNIDIVAADDGKHWSEKRITLVWQDDKWMGKIIEYQGRHNEWTASLPVDPITAAMRRSFPVKISDWEYNE